MPCRPQSACRHQAAYTLIEMIVAVTVFAVAALGAFGTFTIGTIFLNVENHKRTAAEIAYSRQEELRTVSFPALPSWQEEDSAVNIDHLSGARDTLVEDVDENVDGTVDYRAVTVRVNWMENGRDQEVELATFRSRYR